ncbi:putative tetrahydroxynaphthalene reductase [Daldinia vernicosa]|uniref:putative tetrahydroxynaphthalene reductase n=1 Tax=Daldinia vernicosa TaxID=114800 RepID=UPI002007DF6B|nr:putative tetrahydroxynaphthalene reductase [Daldinia vernicosa]KAI0847767.1 putative tetrahydroxynaphthalene reductase [Daldinia vernicosa]
MASKAPLPTLADRVAIVTGSSRGIGRGIALELARRGAKVTINYAKSSSAAEEVVKEIQALGSEAIAVQADVTSLDDIDKIFAKTVEKWGRVDIVVSNSGVESFEPAVDITPERFDHVFHINTRSQLFVAVAGYRYMKKTASPYARRIILTSSIAARILGIKDHALYAGSKSAVEGIVRSLATDFGADGITVNAIAPGGVKSDMFAEMATHYIPGADKTWSAERVEQAIAGACPMGRCAVPSDIGKVVSWLAGDDSEWVTGQVILASGGSSA